MKVSICTLLARKWDLKDILIRLSNQTYKNIEWVIVDFYYERNKKRFKGISHYLDIVHIPNISDTYPYMRDIARNRNLAIANSSGDVILFLDDYTVIDEDFIERHLEVVSQNYISCGKMYYYHDDTEMPFLLENIDATLEASKPAYIEDSRYELLVPYNTQDSVTEVLGPEWTYTGNLAFNREVAVALNGFDPELSCRGEDGDFGLRAKALGYKSVYNPFARSINLPTGKYPCKNMFGHQHPITFLMENDAAIIRKPEMLEQHNCLHTIQNSIHYAVCTVCEATFMLNVPDYIYNKLNRKDYSTSNSLNLSKRKVV